jgi:hypothetical protein
MGPKSSVTFGEKLTFSSIKKVDYAVSDDKKAFEIRLTRGWLQAWERLSSTGSRRPRHR